MLAIPHVIAADWVTGEVDGVLMIVARDVAELQKVLNRLSARGASRLITLLRLEELKAGSPLPLEGGGGGGGGEEGERGGGGGGEGRGGDRLGVRLSMGG